MTKKQTKDAIIVRELKRIARKHGGVLDPAVVVESARPETSPLHDQFQWDDSAAAHAYRLWQARMLIRVRVSVLAEDTDPVRVFVSLRDDRVQGREPGEGGYRVTEAVLKDPAMRARMLREALADIASWKRKYSALKELAGIFAAIDRARDDHGVNDS